MTANTFANIPFPIVAQSVEKPLAGHLRTVCNSLRGKDLNLRPLGYEPNVINHLNPFRTVGNRAVRLFLTAISGQPGSALKEPYLLKLD